MPQGQIISKRKLIICNRIVNVGGDGDEMVNHVRECCKFAQNEFKVT